MRNMLSWTGLLAADAATQAGWDARWRGEPDGRVAVVVYPNAETCRRVRETVTFTLEEDGTKPPHYQDSWRDTLLDGLYHLAAARAVPGDYCPALDVPRGVHGQSQGICDLFGVRVVEQPDGNFFPYPLPADPALIDALEPAPLETSRYWHAVEWLAYARAATAGAVPFRNPVMTGPLDTANYLLGTTTLLEWVYTEPATLHRLLAKLTDVIIRMLRALDAAAGGFRHNGHINCARGGFGLCSEVRALISADIYETFEAPYLRQIGEILGPYAIHSCGSWERTLPSALADPNLRALNGPLKENDLATLCTLADGQLLLSVYASSNVHEEYLWPDTATYLRHVFTITPPTQALELVMTEEDWPVWEQIRAEVTGS